MATSVLSRFAGLKIEDDDYTPPPQNQKKASKPVAPPLKKPELLKKTKKVSTANSGNKKKGKKPAATEQQWELWKQKDEQMVTGAYEAELTEAILLSKLEYEHQKVANKQIKKQTEMEKKTTEQNTVKDQKLQKKQKKKNVMCLEEFNGMVGGEDNRRLEVPPAEPAESEEKTAPADTQFFDRVQDDVEKELRRDKYKERVIERQSAPDEIINRVQFAEALEKKDVEIQKLTEEVTRLKEELLTVKTRNKKLCNILAQGEMRDMAEALVELEKLRQVQSEMTAEVGALHAQLEQERSRNTTTRARDKKYCSKPKAVRFDESTITQKE